MDVSIIIVNYNTAEMTGECISSIYKYTLGVKFEIIVVDNNSNDQSLNYLKEKFPGITLISLKENIGFGRANNEGAKIAKGKYLFLLNSDTLLLGNAIKSLLTFYEEKKQILNLGVIGGILLNQKGIQCESFDRFPNYKNEFAKLFAIHSSSIKYVNTKIKNNRQKKYFLVDYVCGADMFMSKKLFESISGFDRRFFMYYEESDMQKRLHDMGMVNIILPNVQIIHYGGGSETKHLSIKKRTIISTSCLLYMQKHHCTLSYFMFKHIYISLETCKFIIKRNYKEYKTYLAKLKSI